MKRLHNEELISTSELGKQLGLGVSVNYLRKAGVTPIFTETRGTYWRKSDFSLICQAISTRVLAAASAYSRTDV